MLEMVFSKTDTWLSEQYDHNLVKKELWYLGENLRNQLNADIKTVLSLSHKDELMADLRDRRFYCITLMFIRIRSISFKWNYSVVSVNRLKTQALMSNKPDDYYHRYCRRYAKYGLVTATKISAVKNNDKFGRTFVFYFLRYHTRNLLDEGKPK